jgi:hypothetical protein
MPLHYEALVYAPKRTENIKAFPTRTSRKLPSARNLTKIGHLFFLGKALLGILQEVKSPKISKHSAP